MANDDAAVIPIEQVRMLVLVVRGQQVLLDSDLAALYGVATGALNRAVKRNLGRFPADFMFQLADDEWSILRCQSGTSRSWGGRRTAPYVFTEQGVAMLSSVLHSERAILVNIAIMRAFVELRRLLASSEDLARRLEAVERTLATHGEALDALVEAIKEILTVGRSPRRRIGFRPDPPEAEGAHPPAGATDPRA